MLLPPPSDGSANGTLASLGHLAISTSLCVFHEPCPIFLLASLSLLQVIPISLSNPSGRKLERNEPSSRSPRSEGILHAAPSPP